MTKVRAHFKTASVHTTLLITVVITSAALLLGCPNIDQVYATPSAASQPFGDSISRRIRTESSGSSTRTRTCGRSGCSFLILIAIISFLLVVRRRFETTWPFTLAVTGSLWASLIVFPLLFEMNCEFDFS